MAKNSAVKKAPKKAASKTAAPKKVAKKSTAPKSAKKTSKKSAKKGARPISEEARAALRRLEEKDPGLGQILKKAHGFAVFPNVGKASLVVGGSYGEGAVFERGKLIGYATIGQTTIGVQLGGSTFSEVLVFENKEALDRFKKGKVRFAANASAVLVKAGATATKDLEKGIKAIAYSKGGMTLELAIGGQKFGFKPTGAAGQGEGGKGSGDEGDDGSDDSGGGQSMAGRAAGKAAGWIAGKIANK